MNTKYSNLRIKLYSLPVMVFLTILLSANASFSQCKSVAKKCVPGLAPYLYTGQLNSTSIYEGETAELVMTFTGGQRYRILSCSSAGLGDLRMVILDSKKAIIFNNKDHDNVQVWDLNVESSDDYTIQISIPQSKVLKAGEQPLNGCVAILVGFKSE